MPRVFNSSVRLSRSRTCDDLGLSEDDLLGDAALSLVQLLTDAGDHTQAVLQSMSGLLTNELKIKKTQKHLITKCRQGLFFIHPTSATFQTMIEMLRAKKQNNPELPHRSLQRHGASQSVPGSPSAHRSP